jgi:uncharacterized membrane protein
MPSRLLDAARVERAIAEAERRTSGEIRVSVSPFFWGNVHRAADRAFQRLGMHRTRRHNGVLIFIVPSRRAVVVLGDSGIQACVGNELWRRAIDAMMPHFGRRDFTDGVVRGIAVLGEELARHFPADSVAEPNELPDTLDQRRS